MATFIKGDVVVVPFPFSGLTNAKRRPALVIADLTGNDVILCQITSKNVEDSYSITITDKIGQLKVDKMQEITEIIITILKS